ncbi:DsbA family protein [Amaricoccus macauensis]|uniref:DsbA family protein n=1 Tax=Amaricoccus macauensis TaxID=57001 RepID=UPI003C7D0B67
MTTRHAKSWIGLAAALFCAAAPVRADSPLLDLDAESRAALHEEIRSYLLENPEIMMEMYALLEEQQRAATAEADKGLVARNATAIFDDGYSYEGGNPEGDLTIVEFLDYQCGYCRKAHPELAELLESDGEIRWIIKEFPILGPNSELAARAAISTQINAGEEAYLRLHNAMMEGRGQVTEQSLDALLRANDLDPEEIRAGMDAPEVTERINGNRALAETLQVSGTPTFVFEDELVRGYVPLEQMQALVEEKRAALD